MEIYNPEDIKIENNSLGDESFLNETQDDKPYSFWFSLKITFLIRSVDILVPFGILALIVLAVNFLFFFFSYNEGQLNYTNLLYDITISASALFFLLIVSYLLNTFYFVYQSRRKKGMRARIYKEGILFASESSPLLPRMELKKRYDEFTKVYSLKEAYLFVADYAYKRKMIFVILKDNRLSKETRDYLDKKVSEINAKPSNKALTKK